jgi:hypothetical protein
MCSKKDRKKKITNVEVEENLFIRFGALCCALFSLGCSLRPRRLRQDQKEKKTLGPVSSVY